MATPGFKLEQNVNQYLNFVFYKQYHNKLIIKSWPLKYSFRVNYINKEFR